MHFLSECIKRVRFKFIIIVYIIGSMFWGLRQYKDKIDWSVLKTFTIRDIQNIVDGHFEEKEPTESITKRRLVKNESDLNLQRSFSSGNDIVFQGRASVISGVTFKLLTSVEQSWRTHITRNIHLYGVDTCAPRQKAKLNGQEWPCGAVTTAWLVTKTLGQNLSCKRVIVQNNVSYAQCFVNGVDLAEVGLAEGMLVLSKENKNPIPVQYRKAEETARNSKIGLWSSNFTDPLQWRRDNGSYNPFTSL
ncbi:hypothetical protein [Bartonella sp. CB169]|uniref:hypothetical protein n=1 Tax=Bartonella sp. CB169 TaxID=3112257 RepID=UPI00300E1BF5